MALPTGRLQVEGLVECLKGERPLSPAASLTVANPQHIMPRVGFYFFGLIARN
jgi:hypothetical protein